MDEARTDIMDSDCGGMVDRITGMEVVVFGVSIGIKVVVMPMGIDEVTMIAELERTEAEMMTSEDGITAVVFVVIAELLLLLGWGVLLIGASERVEEDTVCEGTVSAIVAALVAARAGMDVGSFTPAIAQS